MFSKRQREELKITLQRSKKRGKFFAISRKTIFYGPRKVGLDSSVLIDLIDNPSLFQDREMEVFRKKDLFFTHQRCVWETRDKLVEKQNIGKEEAVEKVYKFLVQHNVKIIKIDKLNIALLKDMIKKCRERKIHFHPPDSFIIADFKKFGINKVFSTNNHFLAACRLFRIEAIKFPTEEKEIDQLFRSIFYKKRKRFRVHHK